MATRAPASPTGTRPYNAALLTTFAVLATTGLFLMRIILVIKDAPVGFNDVVAAGTHPNGLRIKKNYSGIGPIDEVLAVLVTAFMPGAAGWNEAFYWQQFHFLSQITVAIAIMNVEACRERNSGSWLKYTGVVAFLYQNIGGAVIIPIWMLLLHRLSGRNQYFASGRAVPVEYARVILPGAILFYVVPMIAVYIPGWSMETLQNLLAFWQFTPILANIPLWLVSPTVTSSKTATRKNADLPHLKFMYNFLVVGSIATHMFTIFKVVSSETPGVSLKQVFLPNPAHWLTSMDRGLLWIFQWDWIICALVHIIPATIAIYDVVRIMPDADTDPLHERLFKGVYIPAALVVLGGPGAALAGVWVWREEQMVIIEERAGSGKKTS